MSGLKRLIAVLVAGCGLSFFGATSQHTAVAGECDNPPPGANDPATPADPGTTDNGGTSDGGAPTSSVPQDQDEVT